MVKLNYKEVCVITECPFCHKANEVEVNEMDYWDWQDGALAQDAFPYLSTDERELLISGICPKCWDDMFGGYEDGEPAGVLDDYALEFMEHMDDEDKDEEG